MSPAGAAARMIGRRLALGLALFAAFTVTDSGAIHAPDNRLQPHDRFEQAVRWRSTSPLYVAITVVDERTGIVHSPVCVISGYLLYAMWKESGQPDSPAGSTAIEERIVSNTSHVFHFSDPESLRNVTVDYTPADLDFIRGQLAGLTPAQLDEGFSSTGALHKVYRSGRGTGLRDATACVLFERGYSPGMTDMGAQIYL